MNHQLATLWLLLAGLAVLPFRAAAQPAQQEDEDDGEEDELGPWTVTVPTALRHKGYALRIDGHAIRLDRSKITLRGARERQRIELVDAGGRVLSDETAYVDSFVFDFVHVRTWRLGVAAGNAEVNGHALKHLLQNGELPEVDLDLDWQPGALGLRLGYASQNSSRVKGLTRSDYTSEQWRLEATYEFSPVGRTTVTLFAGALAAHDKLTLDDGLVSLTSSSVAAGPLAGLDLRYPFTSTLSAWVRGTVSYHKVDFKDFDFRGDFVERAALLGGSYAF